MCGGSFRFGGTLLWAAPDNEAVTEGMAPWDSSATIARGRALAGCALPLGNTSSPGVGGAPTGSQGLPSEAETPQAASARRESFCPQGLRPAGDC